MANYDIAIEYKARHLTRPMLDGIIGAALARRPTVEEIIVRCHSAARTAFNHADELNDTCNITNRNGTPIRITIAINYDGN